MDKTEARRRQIDIGERFWAMVNEKKTPSEISKELNMPESSVRKVLALYDEAKKKGY